MSDFVTVDPLIYLKGVDLASQTSYRNTLTERAGLDNSLAREQQARQRNFLASLAANERAQVPDLATGRPSEGANPEFTGPPNPAAAAAKAEVPLYQQQLAAAGTQAKIASLARSAGLPAEADKATDNARQLMDSARQAQHESFERQMKGLALVSDIADSVTDPFTFEVAKRRADAVAPGAWKDIFGMPDQWTPEAQSKIKQIGQQSITAKERIEIERKAAEFAQRKIKDTAEIENMERTRAQKDQDISLQRAGLKVKVEELGERRAERQEREVTRKVEADDRQTQAIVKDVQGALSRNSAVKDLDRYEQGRNLADNIREQVEAPGNPYDKLTPAMADALKKSYLNMAEGFRSRQGGKWASGEVERFNGLMQKVERYVGSIGGGTPALSRAEALDIAGAMKDMSDLATAQVLKSEITAVEAANKRDRTGRAGGQLQLRAFNNETLGRLMYNPKTNPNGPVKVKETYEVDGKKYPKVLDVSGTIFKFDPPGGE